ncbi:MAG: CHAT domain-containing protein, partial [Cyanobacteria bacterium J06639_1]
PLERLTDLRLNVLGNVLRLSGDLDEAKRVLTLSLALAESAASTTDRSRILTSLGNVERASRNPEAAREYYQQAIAIAPTPSVRIQAQLDRLDLALTAATDPDLDTLWRDIRSQLDELPRSRAAADARIHWLSAMTQLRSAGRVDLPWAEMAGVGTEAVDIARDLRDPRTESYALGTLGTLYERAGYERAGYERTGYERTGQLDDARALTERALLMAQSISATDIAYQWQWQLGRILKARDRYDDALAAYSVAYDTLQSLRRDLVAVNPDVQFTFRDRVEPVYREYVDLLLQDRPETSPGASEFQRAREAIEALQLAELDNFFRSACLDAQVVALDTVDRVGTAVLYPIILGDRVEVILSLPEEPLQHFVTRIPQAEVDRTLLQLRRELAKPYTSPSGKQLGQQAYDWLIRQALPALDRANIDTLAFVLDGTLRDVPMAALHDGDRYLIERFAVAIAPGLQLVAPRSLAPQQLQALTAGLTQSRHGFSPLRYVSSELERIDSTIASRTLLDESFTSDTLSEQIAELPYPIIHLATHGQFSSNADDTFVLAWDKPIQVEDFDTLLRRRDAPDAAVAEAIELLVLSACDTAAGDDRATLGLAGLALRAGARSTLASLWALDDESGAQLMGQFYRELAQSGTSKAEALRRAQLTLLADPDYRHPAHWSPFILVGNWL